MAGEDAILAAFYDTTERRRAEAALRASEERFYRIFEGSNDAILLIDPTSYMIHDANPQAWRMLGYSREELLSLPMTAVYSRDPSRLTRFVDSVSLQGSGWTDSLSCLTKSGDVISTEISASHSEIDGSPRLICVVQDVTERKRMELEVVAAKETAERASSVKSGFNSQMSHEFRTPLHTISMLAQMLDQDFYGPLSTEQAQRVEQIGGAASHLGELIDDVLEFSKDSEVSRSLNPSDLDVAEVCDGARRLVEPLASKHDIEIEVRMDRAASRAWADRRSLTQILVNLLSNSIKATSKNGKVGVVVQSAEQGTCFSVWDTGSGISNADLSQIFEPFTQLGTSSGMAELGSGLGLTLVKRLVQLSDGEISVESELGTGSRFNVFLPDASSGSPEDAAAADDTDSRSRLQMLIVEDHEVNASMLNDFFESEGYSVIVALDGRSALEALNVAVPDVVLLDMVLPDINGLEVLYELRSTSRFRSLPVIAITANSVEGDRERTIEAGATAFVAKPVDIAELRSVVKAVLSKPGDRVRAARPTGS